MNERMVFRPQFCIVKLRWVSQGEPGIIQLYFDMNQAKCEGSITRAVELQPTIPRLLTDIHVQVIKFLQIAASLSVCTCKYGIWERLHHNM